MTRMPAATSHCPRWLLPTEAHPLLDSSGGSLGEEGKKPAPGDAGCGVGVRGGQDDNCQGLENSTRARRQPGSLHALSAKVGMS